MTVEPVEIALHGVERRHAGPAPFRISAFEARASDRIAVGGLDAAGAELFVHLVTGALLPDTGDVRIAGCSTRDIATDTDWLTSLDRFGLVTSRAALLDQMTVRANMALPLTVSIDPVPETVRLEVDALATAAGLGPERLVVRVADLTAAERLRLHLARALVARPRMLLLEHPTAELAGTADAGAIGATVARLADARGFGWVALTNDERFARASGSAMLRLDHASGKLTRTAGGNRGLLSRLWRRA